MVAGTVAGMVAMAAPASALPTCGGLSVGFKPGAHAYLYASTSPNSGNRNCVLGVGNSGSVVRHLQTSLRNCYGQAIAVDGVYGSQTANAVRNVQRFHGIGVDGVLGPVTNSRMTWADDGGSCVW